MWSTLVWMKPRQCMISLRILYWMDVPFSSITTQNKHKVSLNTQENKQKKTNVSKVANNDVKMVIWIVALSWPCGIYFTILCSRKLSHKIIQAICCHGNSNVHFSPSYSVYNANNVHVPFLYREQWTFQYFICEESFSNYNKIISGEGL